MARGYDELIGPLVKAGGAKLRERRVSLKLTMMDITLKTRGLVNSNFISSLETGRTEGGISWYRMAVLGEVCGLSPRDMYDMFGMQEILAELELEPQEKTLTEMEEGK